MSRPCPVDSTIVLGLPFRSSQAHVKKAESARNTARSCPAELTLLPQPALLLWVEKGVLQIAAVILRILEGLFLDAVVNFLNEEILPEGYVCMYT